MSAAPSSKRSLNEPDSHAKSKKNAKISLPLPVPPENFELVRAQTSNCQACGQRAKGYPFRCLSCTWTICSSCQETHNLDHTCLYKDGKPVDNQLHQPELPARKPRQRPSTTNKKDRTSTSSKKIGVPAPTNHNSRETAQSATTDFKAMLVNPSDFGSRITYDPRLPTHSSVAAGFGIIFPEEEHELDKAYIKFVPKRFNYEIRMFSNFDVKIEHNSIAIYRRSIYENEENEQVFSITHRSDNIIDKHLHSSPDLSVPKNNQFTISKENAIFRFKSCEMPGERFHFKVKPAEIVLFYECKKLQDSCTVTKKVNYSIGSIVTSRGPCTSDMEPWFELSELDDATEDPMNGHDTTLFSSHDSAHGGDEKSK